MHCGKRTRRSGRPAVDLKCRTKATIDTEGMIVIRLSLSVELPRATVGVRENEDLILVKVRLAVVKIIANDRDPVYGSTRCWCDAPNRRWMLARSRGHDN